MREGGARQENVLTGSTNVKLQGCSVVQGERD